MPCLSNEASQLLDESGKQDLKQRIEACHSALVSARVEFIQYGTPEKLSDKRRAKLNCELLKQVVIHRADSLMSAIGQMLAAKNLYGMALVARGLLESVAVLGYFSKRLSALSKGNIEFSRFEMDIANELMGAKHSVFDKANAPVNILSCVENADKHLDAERFNEKRRILEDEYNWLSEFAHPNFCSNKTAFTLDNALGRMVLRNDGLITDDHFRMLGTVETAANILDWLLNDFTRRVEENFPGE